MQNRKICFISLNAYPVLKGNDMQYVGGAEVQQVLIARELMKHGFPITFITYNDGQDSYEIFEGIEIIKTYKREDATKLSLVRKAWMIWNAVLKARADIIFHEAGSPGIGSILSKIMGQKFVQYIASDADVSGNFKFMDQKFYTNFLIWIDIKLANVVIAQSAFQQSLIKRNFKKDSLIIKNAFSLRKFNMPKKTVPPIVLWVATIGNVKQPDLFLKLAESIPDARFQMIGGAGNDSSLYCKIEKKTSNLNNLEFLGFIPFYRINEYFKNASLFVSTSKFEGFPNVFIQAWMNYVPVVSLNVDPDEIICTYKLGFHSRSFDKLVNDTRQLIEDCRLRQEMGKNSRKYAEREHDIEKVIEQFVEVLNQI
jgi:glycosyltransferase involved in cell wall biosynthesis